LRFKTVTEWLTWQEGLNPKEIELGLNRVLQVKQCLDLAQLDFKVLTVAGTNGKGSSVAILSSILNVAGYRVGAYTSPHLIRYNERITINDQEISDQELCCAFEQVDQARGDIPLTYFEFGTLAALVYFKNVAKLDVVILEVGLGGRLDAVNAFEPNIALITTIDIDHTDWLGDTRESIAKEKAGILRKNIPLVYNELNPPQALLREVERLAVNAYYYGVDYKYDKTANGWTWTGPDNITNNLVKPSLMGEIQYLNASGALMVLTLLKDKFVVSQDAINQGLKKPILAGRYQVIHQKYDHIFDVAHNVQSAAALVKTLSQDNCNGQTHAIFAMLSDKDMAGVIDELKSEIDLWHVPQLNAQRAASVSTITEIISSIVPGATKVNAYASVSETYTQVLNMMQENDRIVIFGSFYVVAGVLQVLHKTHLLH